MTKFAIWVTTAEGATFMAFTWTLSAASGIARAVSEGKKFGHNIVSAKAVPITASSPSVPVWAHS